MKRSLLVMGIISLLAGCSSSAPDVPVLHPEWPDPIQKWEGHWEVKVIDGKAWVGMPFEESQEYRIWMNDILRYTKDANGMICYYRSDLKEPRCVK